MAATDVQDQLVALQSRVEELARLCADLASRSYFPTLAQQMSDVAESNNQPAAV